MSSLAESSEPQDFRVADWLVQPSRNRLVHGETAVRVRPQLIDVLACLARRPGAVISKDELLSTVWSDRFVAESGIARCIAELRQAMADDARTPTIIETIPKRGYRLVAAVGPGNPERARPAPVAPLPALPPTVNMASVPPRPIWTAVFALGMFLREHVRLSVR
jgi:DNA-binding winged helix-turn-helix (wHTH) protein